MDVECTIITGKICRQFSLLTWKMVYWSAPSFSRRAVDVVNWMEGENRLFSPLRVSLY